MQFNLLGKYNQVEMLKLDLTLEDVQVLDYVLSVKDLRVFKKKYIEDADKMGVWISYDSLIDELPVVFASDKTEYLNTIKKLHDLEKKAIKNGIDIKTDKDFIKEYKTIKDKEYTKYRKKVQRILKGSLSKILGVKDISTPDNKKGKTDVFKGKRMFFYIEDEDNLEKLLLKNTNKTTFLENNDKVDNSRIDDLNKDNEQQTVVEENEGINIDVESENVANKISEEHLKIDEDIKDVKKAISENVFMSKVANNDNNEYIKLWLKTYTKEEIILAISTVKVFVTSLSYISKRLENKMYDVNNKVNNNPTNNKNKFDNFKSDSQYGKGLEELLLKAQSLKNTGLE